MAGRRKGKVWCGAPVTRKLRCHMCGYTTGAGQEWPECPKCQAVPRPWCEAFVRPGDRCTKHGGAARHPDCPEGPPPDPIKERTEALLRGLSEEERAYVLQVENAPLRVMQARLASIHAVRATANNNPEALAMAVNTAQVVARTRLLEVQEQQVRLQVQSAMKSRPAGAGQALVIQVVDFDDEAKSERVTELTKRGEMGGTPAPEADAPGHSKS